MIDLKIAFIGLPSSSKSSIINSLICKRILDSDVCKITTEYNLLENIIEDDNKFKVIDLPSICNSEESDINFNELTNKYIKDADLIIWTNNVNKVFITTHEVNEYYRIHKDLNNNKLYYLKKVKNKEINEEISDSEDTNNNDLINKVNKKFSNEDIIYFNVFGKSRLLKKFIKKNNYSYYLYIHYVFIILHLFYTNYVKNFNHNNIYTHSIDYYNNLNNLNKEILYNKLLFDYTYDCTDSYRINVISKIDINIRYKYNFENNFNQFIMNCNINNFQRFRNVIQATVKNQQEYSIKYDTKNTSTEDIYINYLKLFDNIYLDDNYILLNKIEILHNIIINKQNIHINCSYYYLLNNINDILLNKLINNKEWITKTNLIWDKIYSNIKV